MICCSSFRTYTSLLAIIAKYSCSGSGGLQSLLRCLWKNTILNGIRVDDWTAELTIIASNDDSFTPRRYGHTIPLQQIKLQKKL